MNLTWIFFALSSYCAVSVYLCNVYSIVYLADGLSFHKLSSTERYNFNILKKVLFHKFLNNYYGIYVVFPLV